MNELDDIELAKLEKAVSALKRITGVGGDSSTSVMVGAAIAGNERRIEALKAEGAGDPESRERKEEARYQYLAIAYLADQEQGLTSAERAQYGSFLERPFFTRADFTELNGFYGSAYDRLSDRGKAEMSHRVWEGIRQGEYLFTDLPENVKEKESERLYALLADTEKIAANLQRIPSEDRKEFMAAMEAGRKEEAARILNGEGFRDNVALSPTAEIVSRESSSSREEDDRSIEEKGSGELTLNDVECPRISEVSKTGADASVQLKF